MREFKSGEGATRLCFGMAGISSGLIGNGISFFLLIYYNQVLGLAADLAGLALLIGLCVDAVSDPIVGAWSDRLSTTWGRRHPFLYCSLLPTPLLYYALWAPPNLDDMGLFIYLMIISVMLRLSLTVFNVPLSAMVAELTSSYEERTRLINWLTSFAWFFGAIMAVAMYTYWLADTPEYPDGSGILRAEGYVSAGFVAAILIFFTMTAAVVGTHRHIPLLKRVPAKAHNFGLMLSQIRTTLSDQSVASMLVFGLLNAAVGGTINSLWVYMQPYFWGFDTNQISLMLLAQILSAVFAFVSLDYLTGSMDKKQLLIWLSIGTVITGPGAVFLRLLGLFPENGDPILFPLMLMLGVVQITFVIMASVVTGSMISDLVEERELSTGRREEGVLMAVQTFIGKVFTGLGIWVAGLILVVANFPTETQTVEVSAETMTELGSVYGPVTAGISLASLFALYFYRISRSSHEATLSELAKRTPERRLPGG